MFNIMSFKKCKLKPQGIITTHLLDCQQISRLTMLARILGELELPYAVDGNVELYHFVNSLAVS